MIQRSQFNKIVYAQKDEVKDQQIKDSVPTPPTFAPVSMGKAVESGFAVGEDDPEVRLQRLQDRVHQLMTEISEAVRKGALGGLAQKQQLVGDYNTEIKRLQWAKQARAPIKSAPQQHRPEAGQDRMQCFSVVCKQVLIKKEPQRYGPSWGLVDQG